MSNEQQPRRDGEQEDPYFNVDQQMGEVRLWERDWMLRLQAHVSEEAYSRGEGEEIIALQQRRGVRTYVHARPYILQPDYRVTVALHAQPDPSGSVGTIAGSEWRGMRRRLVGNAQGWYYPTEQTIILWECFFEYPFTTPNNRTEDPNLRVLWRGFERFLGERCPAARQLVTTYDDPVYETQAYQRFLGELGYRRLSTVACGKEVPQP